MQADASCRGTCSEAAQYRDRVRVPLTGILCHLHRYCECRGTVSVARPHSPPLGWLQFLPAAMGLGGIVSKRRDAPYRFGRTETWVKAKCRLRRAYPIVAFVEKLGASPLKVASL